MVFNIQWVIQIYIDLMACITNCDSRLWLTFMSFNNANYGLIAFLHANEFIYKHYSVLSRRIRVSMQNACKTRAGSSLFECLCLPARHVHVWHDVIQRYTLRLWPRGLLCEEYVRPDVYFYQAIKSPGLRVPPCVIPLFVFNLTSANSLSLLKVVILIDSL